VVSDASLAGARATRRIAELVGELGLPVKHIAVVVDGAEELAEPVASILSGDGLHVAGFVPHDALIVEKELAAASLLELPDGAPAVRAVEEMLARELEEDA
jgi:CO dehydrogenase nickel-insertion accessory protein CooC1